MTVPHAHFPLSLSLLLSKTVPPPPTRGRERPEAEQVFAEIHRMWRKKTADHQIISALPFSLSLFLSHRVFFPFLSPPFLIISTACLPSLLSLSAELMCCVGLLRTVCSTVLHSPLIRHGNTHTHTHLQSYALKI